jgi:molybdopterin synthase sulfur carrier subunit|tara:strand:+ start:41 stop:286 length:246 start_codon:yes stop_codon:yes gene_type:complete
MIKIKIKCFSQVKYALGKEELELELETGTTTQEVEKLIRKKTNGNLDNVSLSVAVNKKYISTEMVLNDGDEVAFIPPVQGG